MRMCRPMPGYRCGLTCERRRKNRGTQACTICNRELTDYRAAILPLAELDSLQDALLKVLISSFSFDARLPEVRKKKKKKECKHLKKHLTISSFLTNDEYLRNKKRWWSKHRGSYSIDPVFYPRMNNIIVNCGQNAENGRKRSALHNGFSHVATLEESGDKSYHSTPA